MLLAHQGLWPPRKLKGKSGVTDFIQKIGCIQYDPINVVGRNPDLVLQSRIKNYKPEILENLLYEERKLWDGRDKVASIHAASDWPYFYRKRKQLGEYYEQRFENAIELSPQILRLIEERGPLSSIDIKHEDTVEGFWGRKTRLVTTALELLYESGALGIHHKVGTRRVFDLVENLLPAKIINTPDPYKEDDDYEDWHILRRVGGLGLVRSAAGDQWLGLSHIKSKPRNLAIHRLVESGKMLVIEIEDTPNQTFLIRAEDLPTLERVQSQKNPKQHAAIIAVLDNLIWDRKMVSLLFGFDYIWEVYKPKVERKYGYYVLPVIYGDRFVARFEPIFDKKSRILTIDGWWWEKDVDVNSGMQLALRSCLNAFVSYLECDKILRKGKAARDKKLAWIDNLN